MMPCYVENMIVTLSFLTPVEAKSAVGEECRCKLVDSNPGRYAPSTIYVSANKHCRSEVVTGEVTATLKFLRRQSLAVNKREERLLW